MSYVFAGYGITIVAIGGYAARLAWRQRMLTRAPR